MKPLLTRVLDRTPVPLGGSRLSFGGLRRQSSSPLEAYGSVGTLFAIVNTISVAVSRVNWRLYRAPVDGRRVTAPTEDPKRTEVTVHAALDLWNRPNPFMTGTLFRRACQQHVELVGESTIVIGTDPRAPDLPLELWPVRPDRMTPVPHPTEFLTGWIYTAPGGEMVPLGVDQVIQVKMPNPMDPYRGLGPVQAAMVDIDSAHHAAEWNRNFFRNSAEPGGVIQFKDELSPTEFTRFQERWRETHQGVTNAHRVAILELGAEWKPTQFSPKDMQFAQLRGVSRELIREAFTIHGHMLGISQDVNKANAEAGESSFAKWLVAPRADDWRDGLNCDLLPRFAPNGGYEFDHDRVVPEDREADDRERGSRTQAWATLVNAGADPDDAADVVGLPHMGVKPKAAPAPFGPPA